MNSTAQKILRFWFGDDPNHPLKNSSLWWKKDLGLDEEIRQKFESDLRRAASGELEDWKKSPQECLAYIILLDQFSRNIYRNTPQSFAQDKLALTASLVGQEQGLDQQLTPVERWFFYMPMMHSEDREIQNASLKKYRELADHAAPELKKTFEGAYDFAARHAEIVERFGRFPHRNVILGRDSSAEEKEFLKQPGSSF